MAKLKHFDILNIKHYVIFITILGLVSCKETPKHLIELTGKQIAIDTSYTSVDSIQEFIQPYHDRVESILDSTLAYAPFVISKTDGKFNTTAGNLMADIVWNMTNPIFEKRTGNNIDMVLLNHGGIRSIISKGNVTSRTAYEVMPFENSVVVVELKGEALLKMVDYLIKSKRAHPVAGIQLILNKDNTVKTFTINRKPVDKNKSYYVATSDYLVTGGDNMEFFKDALSKTETDYKIRNAMIDFFSKVDTLAPKVDLRYYQLQ
ncbi:5'-nucleotidase C-terminal domain-containing protein [Maribacter ulvicola]|uniref:5'-nucleotidase, C-terminal domain n=1 Tax=Maribacter ulvicola TaxID=228959 RepID=A0A1N6U0C9_9FLAO|nr:5'-nucleotidase [Maribacter ulvicola]SIQ59085.1 5'-nucleotidase, C-terminal domain [Maribacter ulvicola]